MWSPATFTGGGIKVAHVRSVSLLVFDFDEGEGLDKVRTWLGDYRCVVHSSHSHTLDKPKLRAVVSLSRDVTADEFPRIWQAAGELVGSRDTKVKDASRRYFVPSSAPGSPTIFESWEGKEFDVEAALAAVPEVPQAIPAAEPKHSPRVPRNAANLPLGFWERLGAPVVEVLRTNGFVKKFSLKDRDARYRKFLRTVRPSEAGTGKAYARLQHAMYAGLYGFLLPPDLVQTALADVYNPRCVVSVGTKRGRYPAEPGQPYPWSSTELSNAIGEAVDNPISEHLPELGKYLKQVPRFVERREVDDLLEALANSP